VLIAVILGQIWYRGVQDKKLSTLKEEEVLIAHVKDMERTLRTKAMMKGYNNQQDDPLVGVQFTKISGIAMREGVPSVLIDGTVYNEGSSFGDFVIVKITEELITLVNKKTNAIKNLYVFE
jgi:hypothetical protein